jgi:hypothetical protein
VAGTVEQGQFAMDKRGCGAVVKWCWPAGRANAGRGNLSVSPQIRVRHYFLLSVSHQIHRIAANPSYLWPHLYVVQLAVALEVVVELEVGKKTSVTRGPVVGSMTSQLGNSLLESEQQSHNYPWQRWLVLGSFGLMAGFNAFFYMNFSTVTQASLALFNVDTDTLVWQYSATLLASLPAAFPAMRFIDSHNYLVTFLGTFSQVLAGWLRYIAIRDTNFGLCIVSSALVGFGGSVIISTYTTCAQRWFPPHERTLATSIAVQSNYFGWAMGALVVPAVVNEPGNGDLSVIKSQFESLALWQAVGCSLCLVTFFAFHRETPKSYRPAMKTAEDTQAAEAERNEDSFTSNDGRTMTARSQSGAGGRASYSRGACASSVYRTTAESSVQIPVLESAWMLATNGQFMMQAFCYAVLGGVSYTVPAVQDVVFTDIGYTSQENAVTNFVFIFTGVVCGVLLGYIGKDRRIHGRLLKGMFAISAVCLSIILVLTDLRKRNIDIGLNNNQLRPIFIICMGGAGAGTLSFIGIALQKAVDLTQPVSEAIAGGMVEWFLNNFAAIIPLVDAKTFWASTVVTVAVTLIYLVFYAENESSRTSMKSHHQSMVPDHNSMRPETTGSVAAESPMSSPTSRGKVPQILSYTDSVVTDSPPPPQNPLLTEGEVSASGAQVAIM